MKKVLSVLVLLIIAVGCLSLCACGNNDKIQLNTPENLRVDGRKLVWDSVENATGYTVLVDGVGGKTTECFYNLSNLEEGKTYKIEVSAYGNEEQYLFSEYATFTYKAEIAVANGYDEKGFKYVLLEDGSGYEFSRGKANLEGEIVVPEYYKGLPIKKIADSAFAYTSGTNFPDPIKEILCNKVTTSVKLPSTVEAIGNSAFAGMINISEIVLPEGVTEIDWAAFYGCKNLKHVSLPKNLKEIPAGCFRYSGLVEITLPDKLEYIGSEAFAAEVVKDNQTESEFVGPKITEINIPKSVMALDNNAFNGCRLLKNITLNGDFDMFGHSVFKGTAWYSEQPDGLIYLDDLLYGYKGDMPENTAITLPSTVKNIAGGAFSSKTNLKEIYIPDGVKFLGKSTFNQCVNLSKVRLPADLKVIPESTFMLCGNLEQIDIPKSIEKIGKSALPTSLKKVNLSSIKVIDASMFSGCKNLEEITISGNIEEINKFAFRACTNLKRMIISKNVKALNKVLYLDTLEYIFYEGTKDDLTSLTNIDVSLFKNATVYYYSETEPKLNADGTAYDGNYWRYVNGIPTVW